MRVAIRPPMTVPPRRVIALAAIMASVLLGAGCRVGIVTYVVDGDTIEVDGVRIRFVGIDTPERGQCGYAEAKDRVVQLVEGRQVVILDSTPENVKDRYGRELGYVEVDGLDVGRQLIDEGLAHARYDDLDGYPHHPRQDTYRYDDSITANLCD